MANAMTDWASITYGADEELPRGWEAFGPEDKKTAKIAVVQQGTAIRLSDGAILAALDVHKSGAALQVALGLDATHPEPSSRLKVTLTELKAGGDAGGGRKITHVWPSLFCDSRTFSSRDGCPLEVRAVGFGGCGAPEAQGVTVKIGAVLNGTLLQATLRETPAETFFAGYEPRARLYYVDAPRSASFDGVADPPADADEGEYVDLSARGGLVGLLQAAGALSVGKWLARSLLAPLLRELLDDGALHSGVDLTEALREADDRCAEVVTPQANRMRALAMGGFVTADPRSLGKTARELYGFQRSGGGVAPGAADPARRGGARRSRSRGRRGGGGGGNGGGGIGSGGGGGGARRDDRGGRRRRASRSRSSSRSQSSSSSDSGSSSSAGRRRKRGRRGGRRSRSSSGQRSAGGTGADWDCPRLEALTPRRCNPLQAARALFANEHLRNVCGVEEVPTQVGGRQLVRGRLRRYAM